jgi:hypothetical protein
LLTRKLENRNRKNKELRLKTPATEWYLIMETIHELTHGTLGLKIFMEIWTKNEKRSSKRRKRQSKGKKRK